MMIASQTARLILPRLIVSFGHLGGLHAINARVGLQHVANMPDQLPQHTYAARFTTETILWDSAWSTVFEINYIQLYFTKHVVAENTTNETKINEHTKRT